jgi:serine/threonine protein phosphatase PrpC
VRAGGATDPGRVRDSNEDRLHIDVEHGIFLVVDGVGGHAAGEVAATVARSVIVERLARPTWTAAQRVREAIALANNEILRQAQASPEHAGMTCVVTLALLEDDRLTIGHVGDSRLYLLSADGIVKLTHDHSPVGEREDSHEISEAEAMRHPRRNEVFRDVGGAFHEPDDADFIEVIETTFGPDQALLLCSDGLSDMVASTVIERTIRQHAGDPPAAAHALIDAANEAGGKDNVTAVYVEGARFGQTAVRSGAPVLPQRPGLARRLVASRIVALTVGMLAGLALALGLVTTLGLDDWPIFAGSRRLVVGGDSAGHYASIGAAISAARPRDVIRIEPGEYAEAVVLPAGVDLEARAAGTVTLVAPEGQSGWVAITASGTDGNRIAGIRVHGRANAPVAVGFRLAGHDLVVDDVAVEGHVGTGMDILNDGAVVVRSSRFADVEGVPIKIGPTAQPVIRQNVFTRSQHGLTPAAIDVAAGATPQLADNLFLGYTEASVVAAGTGEGATVRARELLRGNYVIKGQDHGR